MTQMTPPDPSFVFSAPVYIPLPRGVTLISGDASRDFLQGLISNDIDRLDHDPDAMLYAALLTPQGKFLHDFFILRAENGFYLDSEAGDRHTDLIAHLTRYNLRGKVTITPVTEAAVFAVFGTVPDAPPIAIAPARATPDPRHPQMGTRVFTLSRAATEQAFSHLGIAPAPFSFWDERRLILGLPDGSRDAEIGVSTLEELNFPELNGVSFTKGCYVGQELTARMHNRNLGRKHIVPVRLSRAATPEIGTDIATPDGTWMGTLRSSCGMVGLALLRDQRDGGGTTLVEASLWLAPKPSGAAAGWVTLGDGQTAPQ